MNILSKTMACRNVMAIPIPMETKKLSTSTYKPNIWKYDHLLSLTNKYSEEKYKVQAKKLKEEVMSGMFSSETCSPLAMLELIDNIDKLGLSNYFEVETKEALEKIMSKDMLKELSNSLNNPLTWRVRWYDVRRNICAQQLECNTNPKYLKLAKLNFNIIQATHQKDLNEILRWWRNICSVEDLSFTRDRIVESFFYAVGIVSEPQHGSLRKWLTKVIELILIIDDVYDIYGSLPQVQQFTRAIEKWDPKEVEWLPKCMQICFKALHDTMEEISAEIQQQKGGPSALPYLKRVWVDFCKALLVEATWYHKGYTPTLEEYLDNGWISSSGPLLSFHVIFGLSNNSAEETLDLCKDWHAIIYHVSLIIRLYNDHGTSKAELERGDVASSILCYMQEKNVLEDVAREYIKNIILDSWKKINDHYNALSTSHQKIVKHVINEARMAHVMYQFGDGFGVQGGQIQDKVLFNLVEPIIT